jgi:hypothetical protein
VLLENGANPRQEDVNALTPIDLARRKKHAAILALVGN